MSKSKPPTYRRVPLDLWRRPQFITLSDDARLAYLALRTGPLSIQIPGVVTCGPAGLADLLAWDLPRAESALGELQAAGLVEVAFGRRGVWLTGRLDRALRIGGR